ncbi:AMP-binding protein [Nostoc sp. CENA67]|uniref:AMP-binding protein n=1 Tax=Amazonocrinis nigriterrae CENA67 TaxID=2794033 RepID=A0A8J7LAX4_9NOST|nr:AMP-binding protein [Amazonocrinis nigriterrae]MBH8564646.1 AMP-binding protein [Amazonocrinis nigriterrae CENA67]
MLFQLFQKTVEKFPKKTAIVYDKLKISYQELDTNVERLSQGLSNLGITKGNCIAVVLPNCPEFVFSFYAIGQLNAIILPLNHLFKEEELSYCIADSQVKAIITDYKRLEICTQAIAKLNQEIEIIVVDRVVSGTHFFYDLVTKETTSVTRQSNEVFRGNFLYQYSSGSTGKPKRICRTQDNLYHEAKNFAQTTQISANDKILCAVPLYHSHGLGNCLLAATCNGATLVILEPVLQKDGTPVEVPFVFRRPRILELIKTEKITIFPGVPYIFNTMAETPADQSFDLSSLRLCFSAGNFLSEEIFDKFLARFNQPIRQLYGCTEAGAVAINSDIYPLQTWTSVGFPLMNVEIKIIDESENELPDGMIGEIMIKSLSLTSGYVNQPELNQQSFKDSCFLTGDLGKKDHTGRLYVTGRKKLLIDTGGRKVDSLEIEEILMKHPKIQEAVVVGVKGEYAGELIKAVLVKKPQETCDNSEIISFCKTQMAEFKIPKILEFRSEIPKSPLGKILRKELV